jgi:hypothetical protein
VSKYAQQDIYRPEAEKITYSFVQKHSGTYAGPRQQKPLLDTFRQILMWHKGLITELGNPTCYEYCP